MACFRGLLGNARGRRGGPIACYNLLLSRYRDRKIYVINADGTRQTRLTNNSAFDASPTWSPDGPKITFYSDRDGNLEIYVMDADGTGQIRLTANDTGDRLPAWSPK